MSDNEKNDILNSDVDEQQLDDISGPREEQSGCGAESTDYDARFGEDLDHCVKAQKRPKGDCANTVESGSRCSRSDACIRIAIDYKVCFRAEAE